MILNLYQSAIPLAGVLAPSVGRKTESVLVPSFGWFITFQDTRVTSNLGDMLELGKASASLRRLLHQHATKRQQTRFSRLAVAPENAARELMLRRGMELLHQEAHRAFNEDPVPNDPTGRSWRTRFLQEGRRQVDQLQLGWISPAVHRQFTPVLRLSPEVRDQLLLPSWCAPQHLCSLETFEPGRMTERKTLYLDYEAGWYGRAEEEIHERLEDLLDQPGCTWDHKLEFWAPYRQPLTLSDRVSTRMLLRILLEGPSWIVRTPVLDLLRDRRDELEGLVGFLFPGEAAALDRLLETRLLPQLEALPPTYHPYGVQQVVADHRTHYRLARGSIDEAARLKYQPITNFTMRQYAYAAGLNEDTERIGLLHLNRTDSIISTSHLQFHKQNEHILQQLALNLRKQVVADPWVLQTYRPVFLRIIDAMWHPRLAGIEAESHTLAQRIRPPSLSRERRDPGHDPARRAKIVFRRIEQQDGRIARWDSEKPDR